MCVQLPNILAANEHLLRRVEELEKEKAALDAENILLRHRIDQLLGGSS